MKNTFVSDLEFENQYNSIPVRSKDKTGDIENIECPNLPEGYSFISAKDIGERNIINIFDTPMPVFADKTIHYPGQIVGILVGMDKQILKELESQVIINFKKSKTPTSELSFENEKNNFFDFPIIARKTLSYGEPEKYFDVLDNVIYSTMNFENRYHYRPEPSSVRIVYRPEKNIDVYIATQWSGKVASIISEVLSLPMKNINIIPTNIAENMNSLIWFPILLATQVAVASYITKKTIALDFSRKEDYLYTTVTPSVIIQHKSVLSGLEKILALDVSIILDAGAFNPLIEIMLTQIIATATGIYNIPNIHIEATAIQTNKRPTDCFSGWGEHYVTASLEKHINELTTKLQLSPVQWRLENMYHNRIRIADKIIMSGNYGFEKLLKAACNTSDFNRKYHAYKLLNNNKQTCQHENPRGIGIAMGLQYNGSQILIEQGITYTVEMTMTTEGKLLIKTSSNSTVMEKTLKGIISKKLNIEENSIMFDNEITAKTDGINTIGATLSFILPLINKCCAAIERQRFRKPLPITVSRTYKPTQKIAWEKESFSGNPFISETPGVCIVELELNLTVYEIMIKGIWLSCSPGTAVPKNSIINDLKKNIATALSGTFVECSALLENFSKYKIINTQQTPDINVYIVNDETDIQKQKGIDNLAENLLPAAYISALNQILVNTENTVDVIPISPKSIFETIKSKNIKNEVIDEDNIHSK
ncbi:MAG: aldehyde oxidase [Treponema sp.]|nr:MAG: aldehyde oxidase [Treponema sp.]